MMKLLIVEDNSAVRRVIERVVVILAEEIHEGATGTATSDRTEIIR